MLQSHFYTLFSDYLFQVRSYHQEALQELVIIEIKDEVETVVFQAELCEEIQILTMCYLLKRYILSIFRVYMLLISLL